jgi:hypothetical protein
MATAFASYNLPLAVTTLHHQVTSGGKMTLARPRYLAPYTFIFIGSRRQITAILQNSLADELK